tara:strand:- start:1596 stop:2288 length:693 start_codon:yes stop_codon:yes gene_type:complete
MHYCLVLTPAEKIMHRTFILSISLILFAFSIASHAGDAEAAELQGYGAFSQLNKDWMLLALYSDAVEDASQTPTPQRLEIKIVTEKFSQRRFRQLWLDALVVEHGPEKMDSIQAEMTEFFNILQGPLKQGDALVISRSEIEGLPITDVTLNYHNLAQLSESFLDTLVQSLVGKHPPTQALKTGLMGHQKLRDQTNIAIRFGRLEPTLPRIAEISRWSRRALARNERIAIN